MIYRAYLPSPVGGGIAVLWQALGEAAGAFLERVNSARNRLPDGRLLLAVSLCRQTVHPRSGRRAFFRHWQEPAVVEGGRER